MRNKINYFKELDALNIPWVESPFFYKLLENSGPKHKPVFKVGVRLQNFEFVNAIGNSKKEAQQKAATLLLKKVDKK